MKEDERRRYVVSVDGSESSRKALAWALTQADLVGALVDCVFVWDFLHLWDVEGEWSVPDDVWAPERDGQRMLTNVLAEVAGPQPAVPVTARTIRGAAAAALLEAAKGADLLVVGSRGHSALTEFVLGSVSLRVIHLAPCPVVVIPAK